MKLLTNYKEIKNEEKNGIELYFEGIHFIQHYYNNNDIVDCNWFDEKDERFFIRYLTEEETSDFIQLEKERKEQYIERLKKYYKRYGQHVHARGYWVNR